MTSKNHLQNVLQVLLFRSNLEGNLVSSEVVLTRNIALLKCDLMGKSPKSSRGSFIKIKLGRYIEVSNLVSSEVVLARNIALLLCDLRGNLQQETAKDGMAGFQSANQI